MTINLAPTAGAVNHISRTSAPAELSHKTQSNREPATGVPDHSPRARDRFSPDPSSARGVPPNQLRGAARAKRPCPLIAHSLSRAAGPDLPEGRRIDRRRIAGAYARECGPASGRRRRARVSGLSRLMGAGWAISKVGTPPDFWIAGPRPRS